MSHWDFAGAGQDDPYTEDAAGWPPGSFPAMFPDEHDHEAEPGVAPDEDAEAPYPLTYERPGDPGDASPPVPPAPEGAEDGTGAPAGHRTANGYWAGFGRGEADGTGEAWGRRAVAAGADDEAVERERTGRRGQAPPLFGSPRRAAVPPPAPGSPPPPAGPPAPPPPWTDWELGPGQHHRRHVGRPVLLAAAIVVVAAAGAGAAVLAAGHPGQPAAAPGAPRGTAVTPAPASAPPGSASSSSAETGAATSNAPLSLSQARAVVAAYTSANNAANAARSDTALRAIENGSSEAIDASLYQQGRAAGTAPFPAFGPLRSTYYLPRDEPATGPRWFAVQVANAFTAKAAAVISTEYLLFTQAGPGGPWLNTLEPYLLSGASAPPVATGPDGLATAVAPGAADAVAPGDLPAVTAAALDAAGGTRPALADPGNLADRADQRQWRTDVPGGTVTDAHAPAGGADGQEFALLTAGGGALVFYTDAATVTVTPPAGTMLHVTVPGYFSPGQAVSQATVDYLEQFAAYDPPSGHGGPGVVADYSAITGEG
jgi:hypothetical protein